MGSGRRITRIKSARGTSHTHVVPCESGTAGSRERDKEKVRAYGTVLRGGVKGTRIETSHGDNEIPQALINHSAIM